MTPEPDAVLVERLLMGRTGAPPAADLEAELRRRAAQPAGKERLRVLLEAYASAAPEYIDEEVQAVARRYLALLG